MPGWQEEPLVLTQPAHTVVLVGIMATYVPGMGAQWVL